MNRLKSLVGVDIGRIWLDEDVTLQLGLMISKLKRYEKASGSRDSMIFKSPIKFGFFPGVWHITRTGKHG